MDGTLALVGGLDGFGIRIPVDGPGHRAQRGVATGLYISARFGPGPRDGLMTGLNRVTGRSIRLVRTAIEVAVVVTGFLLGGSLGAGTVLYALAIGPLAQLFLRVFELPAARHGHRHPRASRRTPTPLPPLHPGRPYCRSETEPPPLSGSPQTPIAFAHRGGAADGVENTAAAFRRAAAAGYRYFETDVHTTADGRLVAFHDPTLDRVTDAHGQDLRTAVGARCAGPGWAGAEPLPLFEELLEEFPRPARTWTSRRNRRMEPLPGADPTDRPPGTRILRRLVFGEPVAPRAPPRRARASATSYGVRGCPGAAAALTYGMPGGAALEAQSARDPERQGGIPGGGRPLRPHRARAPAPGARLLDGQPNPDGWRPSLDLGVDGHHDPGCTSRRCVRC
ncbi:hypothetical protein SMICM17S_08459 [Streptomyces microflavus]